MSNSESILRNSDKRTLKVFLNFINWYLETSFDTYYNRYICDELRTFFVSNPPSFYDCVELLGDLGIQTCSSMCFIQEGEDHCSLKVILLKNLRKVIFLLCVRKHILEILDESSSD